jgi:hypothetical protein
MKKEFQTNIVHHQRFGERQRFANKARQALSEGSIPTFQHPPFHLYWLLNISVLKNEWRTKLSIGLVCNFLKVYASIFDFPQ